jgi:hypothetical protein
MTETRATEDASGGTIRVSPVTETAGRRNGQDAFQINQTNVINQGATET